MKPDQFTIYLDRLQGDREELLEDEVDCDFLDIQEKELWFREKVRFSVQATLMEELLVLKVDAQANASIPCAICNREVRVKLIVRQNYFDVPLAEIKARVFNFKELLREAILLEVPLTVECGQGNCPERKTITRYLRGSEKSEVEPTGISLKDLDWEGSGP